jgi:hypothetical protein
MFLHSTAFCPLPNLSACSTLVALLADLEAQVSITKMPNSAHPSPLMLMIAFDCVMMTTSHFACGYGGGAVSSAEQLL